MFLTLLYLLAAFVAAALLFTMVYYVACPKLSRLTDYFII